MDLSRRTFIALSATTLAAPAVLGTRGARAQEAVTLRLHHFLPPAANVPTRLLTPWAKAIEEQSQGKLKIELFGGMQLGGKPPQLYDQARNGVVDIVWTLPGYTPGRFPSTEVFELPFVAAEKASANAPACQEYADKYLGKETSDVKLLSFWAHDAGLIHTNKPIATMEDLSGLKLRNPTKLAGEALTALGATSIAMPVPQTPEALAQKTIDGCVVPWEVVPALKLNELTKFHTQIPGSPTLYTASFFLAMNKDRYSGLPDDLRAVIDANAGMAFATMAGKMWDDVGLEVSTKIKQDGTNTISTISEDEKARWVSATQPVRDKWIADVKANGVDGAALIAETSALIAKYGKA